ncbi:hypothetical protein LX77_03410 [Gelidibacter algens]|uniref:Uncharacterized protein n=1 Tax=Gelidibacter algens TaxID=49280 RepID=A0A327RRY9_9FLAO|nr:hypothetical protein [Gelidibacter algens]RAJ19780.1 hypothetical protein LX77_03410 [Gelidibacter algens]
MKHAITVFVICCFVGIGSMNSQETKKKNDTSKDAMSKDMEHSKDHMSANKKGMYSDYIKDWPKNTQKAVESTVKSYGEPSSSSANEIVWRNVGTWEIIRISKEETPHNFPIDHTDYMQQTIYHNVPEDKMSELGAFDGSVTFDRTQGYLSARCDLEANNFLALNLAHNIITGKKTVEEARTAYADIIKEKMSGKDPDYMKKLQFNVETKAVADPGVNTTGLTKDEVMAAIKKNSKM